MTQALLDALAENASRFRADRLPFDPEREVRECQAIGVSIVTLGCEGYPAWLASIPDPPKILYVRGPLTSMRTLAVVGSRTPTQYGRRMARRLAGQAAAARAVTVSGMARGIDTEVHAAALGAGGVTWAVLGSGLKRPYPAENEGLMETIVSSGGAVVSEVPLEGPPAPENFPRRNRIISGLSWGCVVVEGGLKSGALITARCALDQGREVFAVPGPAESAMSEGPHQLIRDGARLLDSFDEIMEELPSLEASPSSGPPSPLRGEDAGEFCGGEAIAEERKVLELIGSDAAPFEDLIRETGWDVERLAGVLIEMEMKGMVTTQPGQRYAKT